MKILVLCLPAIGDGLMITPMIRVLRKRFPNAEIDVACMMGGVQYVFKNNPYISQVHFLSIYTKNWVRGIFQILSLRKRKYDVSILSFPSYRREYHWVQAVIGAKKSIAHLFSTGYWLEFNFLNTDLVAVDEASHNVINNLNLTYALDIDWRKYLEEKNVRYDLKLDTLDIDFGKDYVKRLGWSNKKIVAIHPGSTNSPAALLRRWPSDRYAQVARYLIRKNYKVIIFAGPEEKEVGNELERFVHSKQCHLVDNVNFNQSLGILNQMDLLVCNDNGFGHLANALGKEIVTLWASTNDKWSLPINKKLVTLVRAPKFIPWYRYILKRSIPKGVSGGMEQIQVKEVIEAIEKTL
ncbi:MAG: heptosyltransferase II [Microgenomates group bacterium Gr01-1014_16]|nr:MAG: heptosyltransferase II [Microgenomates group bacterium Gr01-1014_16]